MAEPIFMKLGVYIMAPEPILMAYFLNLPISPCVYMYSSLSLLGNDSVKIPLSLIGSDLQRQWIHTQKQNNFWTRRFLCCPYRVKESRWLVPSRTSCAPLLSILSLFLLFSSYIFTVF
jgi:hypothetical protein